MIEGLREAEAGQSIGCPSSIARVVEQAWWGRKASWFDGDDCVSLNNIPAAARASFPGTPFQLLMVRE